MIDQQTLEGLVSAELLAEARNALDVLSVTNYKYEARGRLEGAVKPAPPCQEPPSYVRLTARGKRYRADCRAHGRGVWCIHAVILVLHHLGYKPTIKLPKALQKQAEDTPKTGLRLQLDITKDGGVFSLVSQSAGRAVHGPLAYLKRERSVLRISAFALELMEDLADASSSHFTIGRLDLARLLVQLDDAPLYRKDGTPWQRQHQSGAFPKVTVRIQAQRIHTKLPETLHTGSVFLPGWPGYVAAGDTLVRYSGHVPDLQRQLRRGAEMPLTGANLEPLLREKHGVVWEGRKPVLVMAHEQPGLDLKPEGRNLKGRLGFWYDDVFLPLNTLDDRAQLIRSKGTLYLVICENHVLTKLRMDSRALRLPWDDADFVLRENQATDALRTLTSPKHWRLRRQEADDWFGITARDAECSWDASGKPSYKIGEEWFSHQDLIGGLLEHGRGARLPNGQTLTFDAGIVQKNAALMRGAAALHEDPTAQGNLLARLRGEPTEPLATPELSATWLKTLRPYQAEGVTWLLANHQRNEPALLADDMGLGKTIQTLAYLDTIRNGSPQLLVVPTSLLMNWREECHRFSGHRKLTIHHGPNRTKDAEKLGKADLVITSYGIVRRDIDLFYDVCFQVVCLDEAQAVKNAASQTSQAVAELWCDHRLALTGTPVENRLTELWSIFQFLAPGYLGDEKDMRSVTLPGTAAFEALKLKVAPFLKRRLKSEVAKDLPPKQEITIRLPMETAQAGLYSAVLRDTRSNLDELKKKNTMSILTKLLRLRQVCCHPGLVDETRQTEPANKFTFLLESLEEITASGHAALVFSQFTQLLSLLKYQLEERDMGYLYLDGSTRNRQELVHRFQEGEAPVFLISLKAGGTGLNLTRASYVYHLDPWWNPMVEAQATDRAHRIGQTQKVMSYKLISEGSIEEKILKLQAGKKHLAEGLWGDGETETGLDRDTLLSLLT